MLRYLTDALAELEEEGREIAFHRDNPDYVERTGEWVDRVYNVLDKLDFYLRLVRSVGRREFNSVHDFVRELKRYIELPYEDMTTKIHFKEVIEKCIEEGRAPKDCTVPRGFVRRMDYINEASRSCTGVKCTYLAGFIEPYTLSAWTNDYTACIHRLVEQLRNLTRGVKERGWKYIIYEDASPETERLVKAWAEAVEEFWKRGKYNESDYRALFGYAFRDKVEITVGDAPRHRTHIYIEDGRVEYYDRDKYVNRIMYELLSEYADCACRLEHDGVFCTDCDLERAVRIIAGATSCDHRLQEKGLFKKEKVEEELIDLLIDEMKDILETALGVPYQSLL